MNPIDTHISELRRHRDPMVKAWGDAIRATYPKVRIRFSKSPGQFTDPIGHLLARDLPLLLDIVLHERFDDPAEIEAALDPICRLRSVQEFGAAEAVGWVFSLKKLVRERLLGEGSQSVDPNTLAALLRMETAIDRLALHAFDLHIRCREEAAQVSIRQAQRQSDLIVKHFSKHGKSMFVDGNNIGDDPTAHSALNGLNSTDAGPSTTEQGGEDTDGNSHLDERRGGIA